jgi:hypothetical protein
VTKTGPVMVIALVALLGSGCGSGQSYADPSCGAVLAQLSSEPPENALMTQREIDDLQPLITPGTRLYTLTNRVMSDLESLMSATEPSSQNAAYARYSSDFAQLENYCRH